MSKPPKPALPKKRWYDFGQMLAFLEVPEGIAPYAMTYKPGSPQVCFLTALEQRGNHKRTILAARKLCLDLAHSKLKPNLAALCHTLAGIDSDETFLRYFIPLLPNLWE